MQYGEGDDEPGSASARVAMGPPAAPAQALYHGDDFLLLLPIAGRVKTGRAGSPSPPRSPMEVSVAEPQQWQQLPCKEFLSYLFYFFLSFS